MNRLVLAGIVIAGSFALADTNKIHVWVEEHGNRHKGPQCSIARGKVTEYSLTPEELRARHLHNCQCMYRLN